MITRNPKTTSKTRIWPYTPEPSPPLGPTLLKSAVDDRFSMADESLRLRPASIASRREGLSPGGRPTLDDVLNGRAPSPYTLAAYTAFLSQQHCLETLEFVTEAKKYSSKYYEAAASMAGMPLNTDSDEGFELMQDWCRLLDIYVKPGAPREINLPAEERDDLVDIPYELKPPIPEALDPSVKRMYDLMSDSIFIPFCNSVRSYISSSMPAHSAGSGHSLAEVMENRYSGSHQRHESRRRRSPPTTAPVTQQKTTSSAGTSATLTRSNSARLSMHVSHSSAASDTAMSDDSGSGYSPAGGDMDVLRSPPLTPPQSDMALMHDPKTMRSDSGGWKKFGTKIFGAKKKSSRDR